jgi:hypothetical protein
MVESRLAVAEGVALPDPEEIEDHAIAFAGMMFAHAALEREISALQDAITKTPGFSEQPGNQSDARVRPARVVKLIETYRENGFPQRKKIESLLRDAIRPCEQRNHLAHGTWWCFDPHTLAIVVRDARRWHQETPPEQREYTAEDVYGLMEKFKAIEAELYSIRLAIDGQVEETEQLQDIEVTLNKFLRGARSSGENRG